MGVLHASLASITETPTTSNVTYYLEWTGTPWTREEIVHTVSIIYVIVSILMVLLWSAYLYYDGRRAPRKDTHVIHMLVERTRAILSLG